MATTAQKKTTPVDPVGLPPATPRARVPGARNLTTIGSGIRDAVAGCVGKALSAFSLAQIAILQKDSDFREETPMFDNGPDSTAEKPWQTFDNLIADEAEKGVTAPITVTTDVNVQAGGTFQSGISGTVTTGDGNSFVKVLIAPASEITIGQSIT